MLSELAQRLRTEPDLVAAWAFFVITTVAVVATVLVSMLLRPRTRLERATLGIFVAFFFVMLRTWVQVALDTEMLPQPAGLLIWTTSGLLALNYLRALGCEYHEGRWTRELCRDRGPHGCWTIFMLLLVCVALFAIIYAVVQAR